MTRLIVSTLILVLASCAHRARVPESHGFTFLRQEAFSGAGQTHAVSIYLHEKTGLEFVLVPEGEFVMGSPARERGRLRHEGPQRRVRLEAFLLSRTEVTQKAWDAIGGSDNRSWHHPDLPIEGVSWNEAREWCQRAGLRLPSEAEWEYACRAGTTTSFSFGDSEGDLGFHAWFWGNSGRRTHPVGLKLPNAFGLFDMHGNVWEWVEDSWLDNYRDLPVDGSAWSGDSFYRISRGGSWGSTPWFCWSAYRGRTDPETRGNDLGFRPAAFLW